MATHGIHQDVYTLAAPAGINTLQTFQDKQRLTAQRCEAAVVSPAMNLQLSRDGGTLSGLSVCVPATAMAHALDAMSEGMFSGVSVARIKSPDAAVQDVLQDARAVDAALAALVACDSTLPELSAVMPPVEAHDFLWAGNACVAVASEGVLAAMGKDCEAGVLHFYPAYELSLAKTALADETADYALRDGCAWQARVQNGFVGVFEQLGGDDARYYLACASAVPSLASEVFCAIRSDVGEHCTAHEFADSKEAWFVERLALRNRLRVLASAARALGLEVHTQRDCHAHASQRDVPLAVESCGVLAESLAIDEGLADTAVRHCKGCVDVDAARGPLPVWLGAGQDIVVFTPAPMLRCTHLLQNDASAFAAGGSRARPKLLPVQNVHEESMQRAQFLQASAACGALSSVQDVEHNMLAQMACVADAAALGLRDGFGNTVFEARTHEPPLPVVLCPRQPPKYVHARRAAFCARGGGARACASRRARARRPVDRAMAMTARDAGSVLFGGKPAAGAAGAAPLRDHFGFAESEARPEDGGVVLVWDRGIVGVIQMLMSDGAHEIGAVTLTPRACVADVDA
ncbi:MAG: hypothetical protein CMI16_06385 [Opitutaceae bacterium]|nr:hypothetical protein [Opitutaceae bacterium]